MMGTGYGEQSAAGTVAKIAQYWVEIAPVLKGQEEDYVLINIANEPFGNGVTASTWVDAHKPPSNPAQCRPYPYHRGGRPGLGQDGNEAMLANAKTVAAADTRKNTMFSVHMYEVYQSRAKVENYLTKFLSTNNLPIIVGEFGVKITATRLMWSQYSRSPSNTKLAI